MTYYDRLPYRVHGRHGSRVQRKNARLLREWRAAKSVVRSGRGGPVIARGVTPPGRDFSPGVS